MRASRQVTIHSNVLARCAGHVKQAFNFIEYRSRRENDATPVGLGNIYADAVSRAFSPKMPFIVTGAPHARAYYPRNFAWFYPDLLNPSSILSDDDARARVLLLARSIDVIGRALRQGIHTTTLVPLSRKRMVGINYFSKPSDSMLGLLAALRQLIFATRRSGYDEIFADASRQGRILLSEYREEIAREVKKLASNLRPYSSESVTCLLCDADKAFSSATDARAERSRFVTNANLWTTFVWASELGIVAESSIENILRRTFSVYKSELLDAFAPHGYVMHTLSCRSSVPSECVSIDFAHVHEGFWDLTNERERRIFAQTADVIIGDPKFRTGSENLFLVSVRNPRSSLVHLMTMPSYQGKAAWPAYNIGFADMLLGLAAYSASYGEVAREILRSVRALIEKSGGYPEVVSKDARPYRTWVYRSANARSWLPRFVSVWSRAFGERPF